MHINKCLSIAGSDPSGGAGIQADLKVFTALRCYGMTVLTAVTAQNTQGVRECYNIPLEIIKSQLECIFDDIVPDAIKIGMLSSVAVVNLVSSFLKKKAAGIPIVLDPVMTAKSGASLITVDAIHALKMNLAPLATIVTPNLPEARQLVAETLSTDICRSSYSNVNITENFEDIAALKTINSRTVDLSIIISTIDQSSYISADDKDLCKGLLKLNSEAVLLKGGHSMDDRADDIFFDHTGNVTILRAKKIRSKNTHGTGCTLSAAICAFLARGLPLIDACKAAKAYITEAIELSREWNIGRGCGPVNHLHTIPELC